MRTKKILNPKGTIAWDLHGDNLEGGFTPQSVWEGKEIDKLVRHGFHNLAVHYPLKEHLVD
jgi:hypothetical protein